MRTLILVLAMVALAVATGLSFVLPAAGQEAGSAELTVDCGGDIMVASKELVLLTCTAAARNTGSATLQGAQLEFLPAANVPPPDRYVFWSETHDGVRSTPGAAQLMYDFGDIAPGAASTIVLEIIVRSMHDFGADVMLVAQPDQWSYARTTIAGRATPEGASTVPVRLMRDFEVKPLMTTASYRLEVNNLGDARYEGIRAELAPGTDVVVDAWEASTMSGRFTKDFGPVPGHSEISQRLEISSSGSCGTAAPVLVVTAVQGGRTYRQPVLDDGVLVGDCTGQLADVVSLPYGGTDGPSSRSGIRLSAAAAPAAIGALCLAMGLTMRRKSDG